MKKRKSAKKSMNWYSVLVARRESRNSLDTGLDTGFSTRAGISTRAGFSKGAGISMAAIFVLLGFFLALVPLAFGAVGPTFTASADAAATVIVGDEGVIVNNDQVSVDVNTASVGVNAASVDVNTASVGVDAASVNVNANDDAEIDVEAELNGETDETVELQGQAEEILAAEAAPAEASVDVSSALIEEPKTTPERFGYGFGIALNKLGLKLTIDKLKRAENGLEIARQRLLEARVMADERNFEAAKRAMDEHRKIMEDVKFSLGNVKDKNPEIEFEKKVRLQERIASHMNDAGKVMIVMQTKMQAKDSAKLSSEQKREQKLKIEELVKSFNAENQDVQAALKVSDERMKIVLKAQAGRNDANISVREKQIRDEMKANLTNHGQQKKAEVFISIAERKLAEAKDIVEAVKAAQPNISQELLGKAQEIIGNSSTLIDEAKKQYGAGNYTSSIDASYKARRLAMSVLIRSKLHVERVKVEAMSAEEREKYIDEKKAELEEKLEALEEAKIVKEELRKELRKDLLDAQRTLKEKLKEKLQAERELVKDELERRKEFNQQQKESAKQIREDIKEIRENLTASKTAADTANLSAEEREERKALVDAEKARVESIIEAEKQKIKDELEARKEFAQQEQERLRQLKQETADEIRSIRQDALVQSNVSVAAEAAE